MIDLSIDPALIERTRRDPKTYAVLFLVHYTPGALENKEFYEAVNSCLHSCADDSQRLPAYG